MSAATRTICTATHATRASTALFGSSSATVRRNASKGAHGDRSRAAFGWTAVAAPILRSLLAVMQMQTTMAKIGTPVLLRRSTVPRKTASATIAPLKPDGEFASSNNAVEAPAHKAPPGDTTATAFGWIVDAAPILKFSPRAANIVVSIFSRSPDEVRDEASP